MLLVISGEDFQQSGNVPDLAPPGQTVENIRKILCSRYIIIIIIFNIIWQISHDCGAENDSLSITKVLTCPALL